MSNEKISQIYRSYTGTLVAMHNYTLAMTGNDLGVLVPHALHVQYQ